MNLKSTLLSLTFLTLLLPAFLAQPARAESTILFDELSATATAPNGAKELSIVGVPLGTPEAPVDATLALSRLEVFAPDARITIQTPEGEIVESAPRHAYYGGAVEGRPGSLAVVSLLEHGGARGWVQDGGTWWRIGEVEDKAVGGTKIAVRRTNPADSEPFQCGSGDLPDLELLLEQARGLPGEDEAEIEVTTEGVAAFTARIAFETDQEYLAEFGGSTSDATDYVGDLVALGSMIYSDEVATSWLVQSLNLWTTTDPWTETANSFCRLLEFGKYWNDNNGAVDRTIAHFLSGRSSNSGIAWVGVLCRNPFNYSANGLGCTFSGISNYGGDYGFTSGIDGNFDIDNPAPLWDSVAVLHEIGHNFNSPHTHCYEGLNGSASPVDTCYNFEGIGMDGTPGTADDNDAECWSGAESLPAGCPGPGNNCGTIMSYCHLLSGGIGGNISLTLGESWSYGVLPDRVPTRMSAHVVSQAGSNPGCLDLTTSDEIFSDGFESGNTSAWDVTTP